jgi:hypothetical protein
MTDDIEPMKANGKTIAICEGRDGKGQIGILVHYSFGSMEVPVALTERFWKEQSVLVDGLKPNIPSPTDAFQNTCSQENIEVWFEVDAEAVAEWEKTMAEKVRVEYISMPTKVGKNEYILARRIWVATKDTKGEVDVTPAQPNVCRLKLDTKADRIEVVPFEDYKPSGIIQAIEKVANDEYKRQKGIINRNKHAQAFYRTLKDIGAVSFGFNSGCVFVPLDSIEKIKMFAKYINLAKAYGTTGHITGMLSTPCYAEEDIKAEIARNVRLEVEKEYERLLNETLTYLLKQKQETDPDKAVKQDMRIEEAMRFRYEEAGRLGILKEQYENLLETKIEVKKMKLDLPPNVDGRVYAAIQRLEKMVNEGK